VIKDYEITVWKSRALKMMDALNELDINYEHIGTVHSGGDALFKVYGISKNWLKRKLDKYNIMPKFFDIGHYSEV
jgi:hypothetical protein